LNEAIANTTIQLCPSAVEHDPKQPFIKVFPNPTDGKITVESDKKVGIIRVYDAVGRLVLNQEATDLHTDLDLTTFANGLYLVKMGQESFKIIKK
jgi:Secretion system C-terminal sorting domain